MSDHSKLIEIRDRLKRDMRLIIKDDPTLEYMREPSWYQSCKDVQFLLSEVRKLKEANKMAIEAFDLLQSSINPPPKRNYSFDLCEMNTGAFQLCINLDATTAEEARKESDEIVSVWNSNTVGET